MRRAGHDIYGTEGIVLFGSDADKQETGAAVLSPPTIDG